LRKPKSRYKAFLSYSHSDKKFAGQLQDALQRYAKRWYRRRAFRVFLDESDLGVGPQTWPPIERALRESEYLIVLTSPEAANSDWVTLEIEEWKRLGRLDRLILVLAGELERLSVDGERRLRGIEEKRAEPDLLQVRAAVPRRLRAHRFELRRDVRGATS